MRLFRSAAITTLAAVGMSSPVLAHHSFAMFDPGKVITLNGTVKEFRWVNPHVSLFVLADHAGAPELWAVELTSPGNLTRLGWSRRSLNPGDKIVVQVNPLRNGEKGGGFRKATLVASGQVLEARLIDIEKNGEK
ncbi:DUF6152 family protein [uncultured Sphingomonas sp.]|uniref:DUF6152 family protein n=1 Tax=uncultured Sphingomonas sp. TaxID=158754 RepID=UPI0035CA8CA7